MLYVVDVETNRGAQEAGPFETAAKAQEAVIAFAQGGLVGTLRPVPQNAEDRAALEASREARREKPETKQETTTQDMIEAALGQLIEDVRARREAVNDQKRREEDRHFNGPPAVTVPHWSEQAQRRCRVLVSLLD